MKKTVSILLLLCLTLGLAACAGTPDPTQSTTTAPAPSTDPTVSQVSVDFNALLEKPCKKLLVELKTEQSLGTLVNTYELTEVSEGVQVAYSCQSFAQLSLSGGQQDPIVTAVGTAVFQGSEQVSQTGDPVLYSLPKSLKPGLNLDTANMTNIRLPQEGTLQADIVDAGKLFNQGAAVSHVKITVSYTETAISSIVLSYTAQEAQVTLSFTLS